MQSICFRTFLRSKLKTIVKSRWDKHLIPMVAICLLGLLCGANSASAQSGTPTLSVSATNVNFGSVTVGQPATQSIVLSSTGTAPVTISGMSVAGSLFSASGITTPMTLSPGQSVPLTLSFSPTKATDYSFTGVLTISGNSSTGNLIVNMSGSGAAGNPSLSASSTSLTFGAVTVGQTASQTVTLSSTGNAPVTISGLTVAGSLFSASGITTPLTLQPGQTAALKVSFSPSKATDYDFTGAITIASNATNGNVVVNTTGSGASNPVLSASSTSIAFGAVAVGQTATQAITLSDTGNAPVTISSLSVNGSLFTVSGATAPLTLNPGQSVPVTLAFAPAKTSDYNFTGTLTIASNSSQGSVVVNMSGSGAAGLSAIYCANTSITGAGTDACTVSLSGAAPSGGMAIALASSNSAVTLPASVTVPANATTANFTATVAAATPGPTANAVSVQTATLTATAGGVTRSMSLQLNAGTPTLSVNNTSVSFGNVVVGQTAKQSVTLSSTGTAPVTVSGISVAGSLFSASGITTPLTLNPGQSATLTLQFNADHVSSFTSTLTVASNSSQGNVVISMSGSGYSNTPTLSINATGVSFGNVNVNTPATQSITLSSTGGGAVTVNSATVSGAGFTASGMTFPATLNPGQSANLNIQFDPTSAGAATGQLTISSNSSTNGTTTLNLSGTGTNHEVALTWNAPGGSTEAIAGYRIYRATAGTSSYQVLNSTLNTGGTYTDSGMQGATSYQYYVTTVDSTGAESGASNTTTVSLP